jgi:hypothetical protein
MSRMRTGFGLLHAALGVALLSAGSASTAVAEPGELWESTVEMKIAGGPGFAMAPTTTRSCRPAGNAWDEPPAPEDSECQVTDVSHSGSRMTWNMSCTEPPVTGSGWMEFDGPTRYTGEIDASMPQGKMTMKLKGQRVGDCDYGAEKAKADAALAVGAEHMAQHERTMSELCAKAAREGQSMMYIGPAAMCKEPAQVEAFCAALATPAGYEGAVASASMGVDVDKAARLCKTSPDALRAGACSAALAAGSLDFVLSRCPERAKETCDKALSAKKLDLLVEHCPAEAKKLAQEQCAGRQYTSQMAPEYRGFCVSYAHAEMQAGSDPASQPAPETPAEEAKQGVKKRLKGMLGRK